ncbi:protein chibby homolog 1-like [Colossoma macropomum]|uniref:protein chibby homolog 1-like n=1 Tax=Colossoma macropomum TaxID=42526 RepID=UPI0018643CD2|nr:protein chibby homolog 1-like [Colossoma macropomum]
MSLLQDVWNRLKVQCRKQLCDVWNPNMTPVCRNTALSHCNLGFHSSICDLALQSGPPTLKLGSHTLTFRHGQWVRHGGARENARLQGLRWRLQKLEEENRELKLRLEILIDMLVDTTVHMHTLEREVGQIERVRQFRHPEKNVLYAKRKGPSTSG